MKTMNKRILLALSLIAMMLVGSIQSVFAVENSALPPLTSENSTLTITAKYTDYVDGNEKTTPIAGVEFTLYKVADLSVEDGVATYTATEDFKAVEVDYQNLDTDASIKAAKDLFQAAGDNGIKGTAKESDGNGIADFGSVSNGMYLVAQTAAKGDAEKYSTIEPYLIMAPQFMSEIGENEWNHDVVSIPKMEVTKVDDEYKPPTEDEDEKVQPDYKPKEEQEAEEDEVKAEYKTKVKGTKTGDDTKVAIWVCLLLAAVVAVAAVVVRRRKNNG